VIKICSIPSFGGEVSWRAHVIRIYSTLKNPLKFEQKVLNKAKFVVSFASSSCFAGRVAREILEKYQEFTPVDVIPPWFFTWGMNNRPIGGCSSETWSHPIDMNNILHGSFVVSVVKSFICCM
jgi:hypothetical protein